MAVVESAEERKRMAEFWVSAGTWVVIAFCVANAAVTLACCLDPSSYQEQGSEQMALLVVVGGLFFLGLLGSLRMDGQLVLVGVAGAVIAAFLMLHELVHDLAVLMAKGRLGSEDCLGDGYYDQYKGYCDTCTVFYSLLRLLTVFSSLAVVSVLERFRKTIHTLKTLPEPLTRPTSFSTLGSIRTLIRVTAEFRLFAASPEKPKF